MFWLLWYWNDPNISIGFLQSRDNFYPTGPISIWAYVILINVGRSSSSSWYRESFLSCDSLVWELFSLSKLLLSNLLKQERHSSSKAQALKFINPIVRQSVSGPKDYV